MSLDLLEKGAVGCRLRRDNVFYLVYALLIGYGIQNMSLRILVAGGFDPKADHTALSAFGRALGDGIAERGHTLVNMCLTDLDKIIAEAAFERLKQLGVPSSTA